VDVVTDVELQGPSGVELIERAGRDHPELPVIAMRGDAPRLNEAGRAGASTLLLTPFTREESAPFAEVCLASLRLRLGRKMSRTLIGLQ
jgi:DNA-binding NtrC family response regulator